jgi:hypothetical protein
MASGKIKHVPYENITIENVDLAVTDWFDRTVDAHVAFPNADRKKVPVIFASGERWVTSRSRRGIRDKNGILILPIVSVRRTAIEPKADMQALGTETPKIQIARRISAKTNDLRNLSSLRNPALRKDDRAVYEVTTIPFPDRSIIRYELLVQAQYVTQMNSILEKIFHELDLQKSFVAPLQNDGRHPQIGVEFENRIPLSQHYVVGFFQSNMSSGDNFEEFTDQERIVKWTTEITVPATLQLDPEGEKPSVQVEETAFDVAFGDENVCFVDDPRELEKIFGPRK